MTEAEWGIRPLNESGENTPPDLRSRYLDYLPGIYRENEFLGRFLLIFQSVLDPIERTVENIPYHFDPRLTPPEFLPWLASWVDLVLDPTWPEDRRRELVRAAAELYRWRGTRKGLSEYLRIYTGKAPEITEFIEGFQLDAETRLGTGTRLGSSGGGYHFTVTIESEGLDIEKTKAIIEAQKPAHTLYALHVKRSQGEDADGH